MEVRMAVPKEYERYSWQDYLSWPVDERWELIEGVAYCMSPSPNTEHQKVSGEIFGILYNFMKDKPCDLFSAPFDVKLTSESDDENPTIVQPDLLVCCDKNKLTEQGMIGAPDITVEILSPSTAFKDESQKLKIYEKSGVKEYWIVNPEAEYIMIYRLEGVKYGKPEYLRDDDIIESAVLKGLKIKLPDIFRK